MSDIDTMQIGDRIRYARPDEQLTLTSLEVGTEGEILEIFAGVSGRGIARCKFDTHPANAPLMLLESLDPVE